MCEKKKNIWLCVCVCVYRRVSMNVCCERVRMLLFSFLFLRCFSVSKDQPTSLFLYTPVFFTRAYRKA